jgi:hypothetical protein
MLQDGRAGNYQEDQRCQLRSSSTTSTSDVKIDQSPSRSSITHDEFAKMIHKFFKISVIDKFNKFMDRYKKKEEKKSEFFCFFSHDAFVSRLILVASQSQYGMSFSFYGKQTSYASTM